ncbi:two-component system, OmpR family, sensor kinase [Candidatus Planktophila dulcis]|uniref:sensor histidine kinase n=1 Tax=Candidatus Planktophila dulcis TaxID=1884914 RepID=UPI000BAC4EB5|nr:histidine kinase dimerization/phospho-acceptor domain-containing protein [Candidatus Planktophila dulcis]ASY14860.1 two-component system, OmpR family, sensor kinase [Candidatus Planktophila dulcis]
MKFSAFTRTTVATVFLLTGITMGVGGFSVLHSQGAEINKVDQSLEFVVRSAFENPQQPVGAALFAIEQSSLDISLIFLTHEGQETIVHESSLRYRGAPDFPTVELATTRPVQIRDGAPYRFRAVLVEGDDYVLVARSTDEIDANFRSNFQSLAGFTFAIDSLAALLLFFYFRRTNRGYESASLARMQEFLGDASHELRTPLTVIKGYVEMLSKNQLKEDADKKRAFDRVGTEIQRMESLVQDLLLLAELGESGVRDIENIDLSEVLTAHGTDFITLNPSRNVTLAIAQSITVEASRDYMARFIQNALTNIIRHTDSNVAVNISLVSRGKNVELIIEDAGGGLPESAYREDIRSLNRFDKSRSRENGGSGLGMSIMSAVIQKLGGRFSLRKSSLGGLAIVVELPQVRD